MLEQLLFSTPRACTNRLRYIVSCDTCCEVTPGWTCFSHPAICSGDQFKRSFLATARRNCGFAASLHRLGRRVRVQAASSAGAARYRSYPPLRLISRATVDGERPSFLANDRAD